MSDTKKYVLTKTIHFGTLKETFTNGTVFDVNFNEESFRANGRVYLGLNDFNIVLRLGIMVPYEAKVVEQINQELEQKVLIEGKTNKKKPIAEPLKIIQSDNDLMEREIDIAWTKKQPEKPKEKSNTLEVMTNNSEEQVRGMTVIRQRVKNDNGVSDVIENVEGEIVGNVTDFSNKKDTKTVKTASVGRPKNAVKKPTENAKKQAEERCQERKKALEAKK